MGRTSVSMAASCPKSEILELLLNHLLNPKGADARKTDYAGVPPLTHAKNELEFQKKKNALEDILDGLRANIKKLEERELIDEKSAEEVWQLRVQGKGY